MKKENKRFFMGILIGCILMTTTPVLADDIVQQINVIFDGVEVQINGEKLDSPTILYNGTTYLPMRKVAEAVGKEIDWNPEIKIANIVDKNIEVIKENTNNEKETVITTIGSGIKVGEIINNDLTYTEKEYQAFKDMFSYKLTTKSSDESVDIMVYVYKGELSRTELMKYLNIKSFPKRNEILKRFIDENYTDSTKKLSIQFTYESLTDNGFIGAMIKDINDEYEVSFYNCD